MKLTTKESVTNFLRECRNEIARIVKSDDYKNPPGTDYIVAYQESSASIANTDLPERIICYRPDAATLTCTKMNLLVAIYNAVASNISNLPIDLDALFVAQKEKYTEIFKTLGYKDVNTAMKSHRGTGLLSWAGSFIYNPTSTEFLNRYEFFHAEANLQKQENRPT